jgi:RNA polymerase primary sigma factor
MPENFETIIGGLPGTVKKLVQEIGRSPTSEEIAGACGVSVKTLLDILILSKIPLSFETANLKRTMNATEGGSDEDGHDDILLKDVLSLTGAEQIEEHCDASLSAATLNKIIGECLTPREEKVIRLYYGIFPDQKRDCDRTFEDIAVEEGISKQGIHQTQVRALKKMRKRYAKKETIRKSLKRRDEEGNKVCEGRGEAKGEKHKA